MKPTLDTILQELYSIDGALKDHEKELIPLLKNMMQLKPNAEPNAEFVEHLRRVLHEKTMQEPSSFFDTLTSMVARRHGLRYTLTGIFLGAAIMTPLTYSLTRPGDSSIFPLNSTQNLFSYSVEEKGLNAFGTLTKKEENTLRIDEKISESSDVVRAFSARPQSGGGGPSAMTTQPAIGIFPPQITEYRFLFNGKLPPLHETVNVFKRLPSLTSFDLSTLLNTFTTGPIDLTALKGAKVDMISFSQDTKYGYMGSISFKEGSVSLYQNYEQWPHPENECVDEACYERYRLKKEDIPSDTVLIGIANDFVKTYGLNLSSYGTPEVDRQWEAAYRGGMDTSMIGAPDTIRVLYPMMIEGKPVYEEGGTKVGISIGVNIREKKVSDVVGIMNQQYQKSAYAGVVDEDSIRSFITNFGAYGAQGVPLDVAKNIIEVTLGDPTLSLVRVYNYQQMHSEELLVPALVFPVKNIPSDASFYGTSITVPLAKELFDQHTAVHGLPTPMPMMEDIAPSR